MQNVSECSFADLLVRPYRPITESSEAKKILKRWTDIDRKRLKNLFHKGRPLEEIALELDRTLDSIKGQIRNMSLSRCKNLSLKQEQQLKRDYWILGANGCAKKLNRNPATISYYAKKLGLKKQCKDKSNPPIPRNLLPYDMVKRISVLQRDAPDSKNKVEDAVVIFYDKNGPSAPMMAMHLDELCEALDNHFGRRIGVCAGALTNGYRR
ncbi:gcrA cell cycle regulator family protein [Vibrio sonorensis]|uniref:gcrA cell cycle regulator family protein n=1 Tax=Vibrio sonorensis TaxID=1004316 RepID=UPI0008DA793B|nr:gcrA cell cycle regulator family protein [Vibrio sonorensis]